MRVAAVDAELFEAIRHAAALAESAGIERVYENLASVSCPACQGTLVAADFGALADPGYAPYLAWCGQRATHLTADGARVCAFHSLTGAAA